MSKKEIVIGILGGLAIVGAVVLLMWVGRQEIYTLFGRTF